MQKDHLVLAFPYKNVSSIKNQFHGSESVSWVYLGQDFFKRRHVERELGDQYKRIDTARLLNEIANDIRLPHVRWIDDLNRRYGNSIEWWFGTISSRNPYNSNLFLYSCYLEIMERLWASADKRPVLVVLESRGLLKTIKKWAFKKNINLNVTPFTSAKFRLSVSSLFILRWGNFVIISIIRWITAHITRIRYNSRNYKATSVILDTFVHDYCLSDNGTFKDRYFPYLHEYLLKNGKTAAIHPVLFGFDYNYFSIYRRMRISETQFILQEDFLHISDYLSAFIYPIKVLRQKTDAPLFRGFDISDILKDEKIENPLTPALEAILIYRLFLRLGQSGLDPELVIDWYENQVIDKALISGARKAFPNVRIIGAQMFIHSPNFISLFPSQSEADAKTVPHLLLETSQHQCQRVKSFTSVIPCRFAAALRYSHVFTQTENQIQEGKIILVLLPFTLNESIELLETLKETLELIGDDVRILIKGHPDYTNNELIHAFGENIWPDRFEIFQGSLPEALNVAQIVISSNSSSMVEAATKGIPIIFLGRQTAMNYNILTNVNLDIMTECFSALELMGAIEKYLNLSIPERTRYKEMGNKVRDLFFEPVNEDTLKPFLGFEKDL